MSGLAVGGVASSQNRERHRGEVHRYGEGAGGRRSGDSPRHEDPEAHAAISGHVNEAWHCFAVLSTRYVQHLTKTNSVSIAASHYKLTIVGPNGHHTRVVVEARRVCYRR